MAHRLAALSLVAAAVAVGYRRKGETAWRKGLPLRRIGGERSAYLTTLGFIAPQMFAGRSAAARGIGRGGRGR